MNFIFYVCFSDKNDVILFHLLPSLCYKRTRSANVGVPSVAEARKAFMLYVLVTMICNKYSYDNYSFMIIIKYIMNALFSTIFLQIPGDLNREIETYSE